MPDRRGTDAVLALGERMCAEKPLNQNLVAAVRRSIENEKALRARRTVKGKEARG